MFLSIQTMFACLVTVAVAADALADTSTATVIGTPLDGDGISAVARIEPKDCLVGSNLDLSAMISMNADLQKKGAIRGDVDAAHVTEFAWSTASAVLIYVQPFLLKTVFDQHNDIKTCKFVTTITDASGDQETAYAFDMTRAIYRKIDWSTYSVKTLADVSENFRLGSGTARHMRAEAK